MPTLVDQAVVLRTWDYSETSQTVSLLTRAHGVLRGLAKGSRREKSRFSGGFEPLTRGEILGISKPTTELANLTEWDLQEVFWGPRRALRAHYIALYMADLVHHTLVPGDPHPPLFDALVAALRALDPADASDRTLLQFQWDLLSEAGYRPRLDMEPAPVPARRTLGFDPQAGSVVPDPGPSSTQSSAGPGRQGTPEPRVWRVRVATIDVLRGLAGQSLPHQTPPDQVIRASKLLSAYWRTIMGRDLATRETLFGKG